MNILEWSNKGVSGIQLTAEDPSSRQDQTSSLMTGSCGKNFGNLKIVSSTFYILHLLYMCCSIRLGPYKKGKISRTSLIWTWHIWIQEPLAIFKCVTDSFRKAFTSCTVTRKGKKFLKMYLPCQQKHGCNQWIFYN